MSDGIVKAQQNPGLVDEDEKWDAKIRREKIEDEQRAVESTLSVNRMLQAEAVEQQRETIRLDHELAAERDAKNHDRYRAFNDERDGRVVWIEVVANSDLPVLQACERADSLVKQYLSRYAS